MAGESYKHKMPFCRLRPRPDVIAETVNYLGSCWNEEATVDPGHFDDPGHLRYA